jgi:hypothetical protein
MSSQERLQTLRNIYEQLVARLVQLDGPRDSRGRLRMPMIDGVHYPTYSNEKLAAVMMARTKQCNQAEAAKLYGVSDSVIGQAMQRIVRIQRYHSSNDYLLGITYHSQDPAELARKAMEAGMTTEDEERLLRQYLLGARVNPFDWAVVLAVHVQDGVIAVMVENIEGTSPVPRALYNYCGRPDLYRALKDAMKPILDTAIFERNHIATLLSYLAPLRHQPTT